MIDQIKDKVEAVMRFQRQIAYIERQLTMKTRRPKLKEEERKNLFKQQKDLKVQVDDGDEPRRRRAAWPSHPRDDLEGRGAGEQAKKELVEANLRSSSRSPRSTRTAGCSSSTSFRKATSA